MNGTINLLYEIGLTLKNHTSQMVSRKNGIDYYVNAQTKRGASGVCNK